MQPRAPGKGWGVRPESNRRLRIHSASCFHCTTDSISSRWCPGRELNPMRRLRRPSSRSAGRDVREVAGPAGIKPATSRFVASTPHSAAAPWRNVRDSNPRYLSVVTVFETASSTGRTRSVTDGEVRSRTCYFALSRRRGHHVLPSTMAEAAGVQPAGTWRCLQLSRPTWGSDAHSASMAGWDGRGDSNSSEAILETTRHSLRSSV